MTDSNSRPLPWKPIAVLVTLLVLGFLIWWWNNRNPQPDPAPPNGDTIISAEEAAKLIELRNAGLGHLENGDYKQADAAFGKIITALPEDNFGLRNQLITRYLAAAKALESNTQIANYAVNLAAARKAFDESLSTSWKVDTSSPVPSLLEARFYDKLSQLNPANRSYKQQSLKAFQNALVHGKDRAHLWYEQFDATRYSRDETERTNARNSLKKAYELQPNNLALLRELLLMQSVEKDPQIENSLKNARRIAKPFVAEIKKRNARYNLDEWLSTAITGLQKPEPDWAIVSQGIYPWCNLIKAETIAKQDLSRMEPHPLEFVVNDFAPSFYKRSKLPSPKLPATIPVKMVSSNKEHQLSTTKNVTAIRVVDFDLDGKLDIFRAQGRAINVLSRWRDNQKTKHWNQLAEINLSFEPRGLVIADLDRDSPKTAPETVLNPTPEKSLPTTKKNPTESSSVSPKVACLTADVDVVAFGPEGITVLRNHLDKKTGNRAFQVVEQSAEFQKLNGVLAVNVADLDHDSDLDLIVSSAAGISLWSNRGDMTFANISAFSALPPKSLQPTVIIPVDLDRNVSIDIVLAGPTAKQAGVLENVRHGRFRWREFDPKFDKLNKTSALAIVDADANVSWDLIASTPQGISLLRTQTLKETGWQFQKSSVINDSQFTGLKTWDYDNDGYQDLIAWNNEELRVFRGGLDGQFEPVTDLFPSKLAGAQACEIADWDADGDQDLLILANGIATWYINQGGNANNWVNVTLQAERDPQFTEQRCNIHGVGSLLELKVGSIYQPRIVIGPVTHFGLGKKEQADVIRALWTNGVPQNMLRPERNQSICSQQLLLLGSCPYLYTWNGTKYEFLTDCLWAAPIGLQSADGVLVPWREWEYLRIPGDRLVPNNGEYRMQITEELWEAAYFDSMQLIAIDHPADVEIYSNEKVGPPSIAAYKIHTVKHPRVPIAARDQQGRDVLPEIRKRDGQYLQAYDRRIVQGVTDEHFLELDFGKLKDVKNITLFLTGWIFPSDPSISIAVSQNPAMKHAKPPSLWVRDAQGKWKNVIPYTGFPGGKTKTIAIDLTGKFLTNDYRVRIKTTMELRWDAAFFTVNEKPVECRTTKIPVFAANLHERGFSRRIDGAPKAPGTYDYTHVSRNPKWPPMEGRFTRFGDVTELLKADDDFLVVLGSGDEMTVRFKVPNQPVRPGWKRDFFLKNVGWDKDANMNTVYGHSSEPLPFRAMKTYPYPADVSWPRTPRHRQYLKTYQTREQNNSRFWKGIRRSKVPAPARSPI